MCNVYVMFYSTEDTGFLNCNGMALPGNSSLGLPEPNQVEIMVPVASDDDHSHHGDEDGHEEEGEHAENSYEAMHSADHSQEQMNHEHSHEHNMPHRGHGKFR